MTVTDTVGCGCMIAKDGGVSCVVVDLGVRVRSCMLDEAVGVLMDAVSRVEQEFKVDGEVLGSCPYLQHRY